MTIDKAINRLGWRMRKPEGKSLSFKPDDQDRQSLNTIIDWINDARERSLETNKGFAKLYIYAYSQFLEHYGSTDENGIKHPATVFDEIPQKELHRQLSQPLEYFIKRFTQRLNDNEAYQVLDKFTLGQITLEQIKEDLSDPNLNLTGKAWDEETVEANLMAQISEAIVKFKL